jgi:hypothetical protein
LASSTFQEGVDTDQRGVLGILDEVVWIVPDSRRGSDRSAFLALLFFLLGFLDLTRTSILIRRSSERSILVVMAGGHAE